MYITLLLFVDVYYMKIPNFKFHGGCEHEKKDLTFPFLNLDTFLKNATPKKLAIEDGDVFTAVAIMEAKAPSWDLIPCNPSLFDTKQGSTMYL